MREEVYLFFYFFFQLVWPFLAAALAYGALTMLLRRFVSDEPSFFAIPRIALFFLLVYLLFWRQLDLFQRYFQIVFTTLPGGEVWNF